MSFVGLCPTVQADRSCRARHGHGDPRTGDPERVAGRVPGREATPYGPRRGVVSRLPPRDDGRRVSALRRRRRRGDRRARGGRRPGEHVLRTAPVGLRADHGPTTGPGGTDRSSSRPSRSGASGGGANSSPSRRASSGRTPIGSTRNGPRWSGRATSTSDRSSDPVAPRTPARPGSRARARGTYSPSPRSSNFWTCPVVGRGRSSTNSTSRG